MLDSEQLVQGKATQSYASHIALLAGIASEVVDRAKEVSLSALVLSSFISEATGGFFIAFYSAVHWR